MMGQQCMRTPPWLFKFLEGYFNTKYMLDAFASDENHLCDEYYTENNSGLMQRWKDETFANPPFGKCKDVVAKASREWNLGETQSTLILPVGCSQNWFHDFILGKDNVKIFYPDARIWFLNPDGSYPKDKNGKLQGGDRDTMIIRFYDFDYYGDHGPRKLKIKEIQKAIIEAHRKGL